MYPTRTVTAPLARHAMAFVLAGGRGSRLMELTDRRAKPAVYFGGKLRIIDFALSNALNSGIRRMAVATQYKAHSLIRHLQRGWNFFRPERNESFDILPASQRVADDKWYLGTADAVFQNIDIIESYDPRYIVVLAGDHVYKMDFEPMLQQHVEQGADVTVGCLEVPRAEASGFGVMHVDATDRILAFQEKPADPPPMPGRPDMSLASMGIYVFNTRYLFDRLREDAADPNSSHDFGKDIIPRLVADAKAVAHPFERSCVRSTAEAPPYWRDVGTLDSYFAANIDLTDIVPDLDLFDRDWPIWTYGEMTAPAKFVHDEEGRRGAAYLFGDRRRFDHFGCDAAAVAGVHRRPGAFLCRCRLRGHFAGGRNRQFGAFAQRDHRARRTYPRRVWWSGRTRRSMGNGSAAPPTAFA